MTRQRARALAAWLTGAAVVVPGTAAAQSFTAQPQAYLLTTDAFDARALWLQPAGLSRRQEASFAGLITVDGSGGVSQYGLTLASGGLGLGWQRDRKIGTGTDVFSVGLGLGGPRAGLGADHRWYRGSGAKDGSWDLGARLNPSAAIDLSLVWRDIGTPVFFVDGADSAHTIKPTLVPAASVNLFGRARLAAEWEIVTEKWGTSGFRIGTAAALFGGLSAAVRGDFSSSFKGEALAVSLTWNGPASRVTAFAASGGDNHYGVWAAAVRDLSGPRRGPFR